MMLMHVPADGSRPTLVSFPRDSWVTIPGHGKGKINSAYPDGYNAAKAPAAASSRPQSAGIVADDQDHPRAHRAATSTTTCR